MKNFILAILVKILGEENIKTMQRYVLDHDVLIYIIPPIIFLIVVAFAFIDIDIKVGSEPYSKIKLYYDLFIPSLILLIFGIYIIKIALNPSRLGVKKIRIKREDALYNKLRKNAAKAKKLRYMGTALSGLFCKKDTIGPQDWLYALKENTNLEEMFVLLSNPLVATNRSQQLDDVENRRGDIREHIKHSLRVLGNLRSSSEYYKSKLTVKVSDKVFYTDINMVDEEMIVTHYTQHGLGDEGLVLYIEKRGKKNKDDLFKYYLEEFDKIWNDTKYTMTVDFKNNGSVYIGSTQVI